MPRSSPPSKNRFHSGRCFCLCPVHAKACQSLLPSQEKLLQMGASPLPLDQARGTRMDPGMPRGQPARLFLRMRFPWDYFTRRSKDPNQILPPLYPFRSRRFHPHRQIQNLHYNHPMPDHLSGPSQGERRTMMPYAIEQVKAAQQRLREGQTGESGADPARESLQRTETVVAPTAPSSLVAQWREKYPSTYRRILRAAARGLEQDPAIRHRLYHLLNCAPEGQE